MGGLVHLLSFWGLLQAVLEAWLACDKDEQLAGMSRTHTHSLSHTRTHTTHTHTHTCVCVCVCVCVIRTNRLLVCIAQTRDFLAHSSHTHHTHTHTHTHTHWQKVALWFVFVESIFSQLFSPKCFYMLYMCNDKRYGSFDLLLFASQLFTQQRRRHSQFALWRLSKLDLQNKL
jgi:hypothetical protein